MAKFSGHTGVRHHFIIEVVRLAGNPLPLRVPPLWSKPSQEMNNWIGPPIKRVWNVVYMCCNFFALS